MVEKSNPKIPHQVLYPAGYLTSASVSGKKLFYSSMLFEICLVENEYSYVLCNNVIASEDAYIVLVPEDYNGGLGM